MTMFLLSSTSQGSYVHSATVPSSMAGAKDPPGRQLLKRRPSFKTMKLCLYVSVLNLGMQMSRVM